MEEDRQYHPKDVKEGSTSQQERRRKHHHPKGGGSGGGGEISTTHEGTAPPKKKRDGNAAPPKSRRGDKHITLLYFTVLLSQINSCISIDTYFHFLLISLHSIYFSSI